MKRMFLENFFPASKTTSIRKEICGIRQHNGETLYEYCKRLMLMDKSMVDVASGGALIDKTPIGQNFSDNEWTIPLGTELTDDEP
ncbi:hypothetical protein CR513_13771, partial [Mucuna pruriens]